jgi:hypothetical protein
MILPGIVFVIGLIHLWGAWRGATWSSPVVGSVLSFAGGLPFALLVSHAFRPRLAYENGQLLVYLRGGAPIAVPVESVECCFLAAGAGQIPGASQNEIPLRNLVMRVAERATDFQNCDVKEVLGRWEDGYITIHGAWCEPLTLAVAQRINARLADVHQSAGMR